MPNHVKNRITIKADSNTAKEIAEQFSTHYPKKPSKAYNGDLIYNQTGVKYSYGWLNEETNVFTRCDKADVIGVPKGYAQKFDEAWTRFPDFEKVSPYPEGFKDTVSNGELMPLGNQFSSHTKFKDHLDDMHKRFIKHDSDEGKEAMITNITDGVENYLRFGHATWYGFNVANWGTKWNAYTCEKEADNVYTFETAWSAVPELVRIMSEQHPTCEFIYEYADENTGANAGAYIFNGGVAQGGKFENQSIAAYNMAFELSPEYKDDYKLVDGKYEWIDEEYKTT